MNRAFDHITELLAGDAKPCFLAPFEITLSLYWEWFTLHGKIDVRYNTLAIFAYIIIAFACGVFGSVWDMVGVVLDIFDVSFGDVLLDWIWPVLIKPALQVLISAALGVMGSAIVAAKSVVMALASMFIIQALVASISYLVSHLLIPFVGFLGLTWLVPYIDVVFMKKFEDAMTGPISRSLARYTSLTEDLVDAQQKIGFGIITAIIIAGLEWLIDWFCYTYAWRLTYMWSGSF